MMASVFRVSAKKGERSEWPVGVCYPPTIGYPFALVYDGNEYPGQIRMLETSIVTQVLEVDNGYLIETENSWYRIVPEEEESMND